jgi:hypothetical protein
MMHETHKFYEYRQFVESLAEAYSNYVFPTDDTSTERERAQSIESNQKAVRMLMTVVVPRVIAKMMETSPEYLAGMLSESGISQDLINEEVDTGAAGALTSWLSSWK